MADNGEFRLGLVGWPLGHSLSPAIHEQFLRQSGLAGEYLLYPVRPGELDRRVREIRETGVAGLNVTFPHKAAAAQICDRVKDSALLQVVNTISFNGELILGFNTDTYGFGRMLDICGLGPPFFVVGTGGAALALERVLVERGLECGFYSRDTGSWEGSAGVFSIDELDVHLTGSSEGTVINATTLGWRDGDTFPLEGGELAGMTFADLNYNRGWAWRNRLERRGVRVVTGEVMLVCQAAESFRIWTGIMPEVAPVIDALENR